METTDAVSLREIWLRVFNHVRDTIDVATVWLAMEAATPITLDGHDFVVGLSSNDEYLAGNLQGNEATSAIEDGLLKVTGRVLALRLIEGTSLADWDAQKTVAPAQAAPVPPPTSTLPPPAAAAFQPQTVTSSPPPAGVAPSWDKLNEQLQQHYKASHVKYAQGQARFVLRAAHMISDTMDLLMPGPGQPSDELQERLLAKTLERLGSIINLDPLFLSLEILRYRQSQGKESF